MTPVPWGSPPNEEKWRRLVAAEARRVRASTALPPVSTTTHFTVEIAFLLNGTNIERPDLDNLAKPVLDTLFRVRCPQVPDRTLTGALFDVDDDRVFKLTTTKVLVHGKMEEGADIRITWE
jgi:hypothetical protein